MLEELAEHAGLLLVGNEDMAEDTLADLDTIKRILNEHGLEPAPVRSKGMPWKTFSKAHPGAIAATDFFTVEVLTLAGLVRYHILFVIDIATRRVQIAGIVRAPHGVWIVPLGEAHLRTALGEFVEHYHLERNHQGLDNQLITTPAAPANDNSTIVRRERLGGVLSYYHRMTASAA